MSQEHTVPRLGRGWLNNNWDRAKTDEPVVINLRDLHTGFKVKSAALMEGSTEIPSQLDDLNRDRKMDELAFVTSLPAHGRKTFQVTLSSEKSTKTYPARVYAEMFIADPRKGKHQSVQAITVPGTSNIYSMVRPHGPVLESELVGYRLYFNEKQTPDIYGKFNKGLEIKESQFYPTDEQLARGFGDDVLRVFDSCGPGAFKGWDGKKATHITPYQEGGFRHDSGRTYYKNLQRLHGFRRHEPARSERNHLRSRRSKRCRKIHPDPNGKRPGKTDFRKDFCRR